MSFKIYEFYCPFSEIFTYLWREKHIVTFNFKNYAFGVYKYHLVQSLKRSQQGVNETYKNPLKILSNHN